MTRTPLLKAGRRNTGRIRKRKKKKKREWSEYWRESGEEHEAGREGGLEEGNDREGKRSGEKKRKRKGEGKMKEKWAGPWHKSRPYKVSYLPKHLVRSEAHGARGGGYTGQRRTQRCEAMRRSQKQILKTADIPSLTFMKVDAYVAKMIAWIAKSREDKLSWVREFNFLSFTFQSHLHDIY